MVDRCIFYIILQDLIGTCSQLDRRWQKMTEVNAYVDATSRCIWHHMVTFQVSWIWRRTTQKETGASGCQIASICPFSGCFCSTKETHVFRFCLWLSARQTPLFFVFLSALRSWHRIQIKSRWVGEFEGKMRKLFWRIAKNQELLWRGVWMFSLYHGWCIKIVFRWLFWWRGKSGFWLVEVKGQVLSGLVGFILCGGGDVLCLLYMEYLWASLCLHVGYHPSNGSKDWWTAQGHLNHFKVCCDSAAILLPFSYQSHHIALLITYHICQPDKQ